MFNNIPDLRKAQSPLIPRASLRIRPSSKDTPLMTTAGVRERKAPSMEPQPQDNFLGQNFVPPEEIQRLVDLGEVGVAVHVGADVGVWRVPGPV